MHRFETMHTLSSWPVDVHVTLRLCSDSILLFFGLANLLFLASEELFWVCCTLCTQLLLQFFINHFQTRLCFTGLIFQTCKTKPGFKVWLWDYARMIVTTFWLQAKSFSASEDFLSRYLVGTTSSTVFLNHFETIFQLLLRCVYKFGITVW